MILISNDFWNKRKINNFDLSNVFLAIATNIPQRRKTGFVLQGQIYSRVNSIKHRHNYEIFRASCEPRGRAYAKHHTAYYKTKL